MISLPDFLARYAARPMAWGVDDCSLILADWWRENHGMDPAIGLRGTYCDERGKRRVLARSGGLLPLVANIATMAGARVTATPDTGDFAVLSIPGHQPACGIRSGEFWAMRSADGIGFVRDAEVVRAWAI